ncbi:hypothetical protein JI721_04145 [Alicyclobacillus cycloheptanicus]|uniref:HEPN domain-containing protein n=1 Tax=Alicyclobacillus cycloheptanicus TaxID=1457 RepID=A0ABT9XLK0_9BACL|nr:hypothetical protein [Alicyclobacillus cycloheptanicus]MDQ0191183.1 hypothetical protein [Alicyclobacillus cycloheptanicus]WDM02027.1 hypothetical protein JI721_04145 [Alicyclobacillus cycloheptanicus]
MRYDAQDVFKTATGFDAATAAIVAKLGQTNDIATYVSPFVTVASFTIEVYLKCLFMLDHGRPAPRSHKWDTLFGQLSKENRVEIEKLYNQFVATDPLVQDMVQRVPGTKLDLSSFLKDAGSAFVNWRYMYERKLTSFPTSGPLIRALRERIQTLKPEWFEENK